MFSHERDRAREAGDGFLELLRGIAARDERARPDGHHRPQAGGSLPENAEERDDAADLLAGEPVAGAADEGALELRGFAHEAGLDLLALEEVAGEEVAELAGLEVVALLAVGVEGEGGEGLVEAGVEGVVLGLGEGALRETVEHVARLREAAGARIHHVGLLGHGVVQLERAGRKKRQGREQGEQEERLRTHTPPPISGGRCAGSG